MIVELLTWRPDRATVRLLERHCQLAYRPAQRAAERLSNAEKGETVRKSTHEAGHAAYSVLERCSDQTWRDPCGGLRHPISPRGGREK